MTKKSFYYSAGILVLVLLAVVVVGMVFRQNASASPGKPTVFQPPLMTLPKLPEKLDFAGEPVPLNNFEVRERLDRELLITTFRHASTILAYKRSARWFPEIEAILKRNNIPADFKYLAVTESELSDVTSPAGAAGFWQFMEETAKTYGLIVNDEIDERFNATKATEAACRYLQKSYDTFGNWTMAAASYNVGVPNLSAFSEKQRQSSYYDIQMNQETSRFVFRILSFKLIFTNPAQYGIEFSPEDLYKPLKYYEIEVNGTVDNWVDFAGAEGITYKALRYFNPWIRNSSMRNRGKNTFIVKIPVNKNLEAY